MRQYDRIMQDVMTSLQEKGQRPRLLLHVCCAPCSTSVMERLSEAFELVVYFDNPNLDTGHEYDRRAEESRRLMSLLPYAKELVIAPYDPLAYQEAIKGLEAQPEGGARCTACFRLRLQRSVQAARELQCLWYTTTLTVSPRKDAHLLNHLGEEQGNLYGVSFLPSDFKKRDGYLRSVRLSRESQLYRQDYCGCVFSKRQRQREAPTPK